MLLDGAESLYGNVLSTLLSPAFALASSPAAPQAKASASGVVRCHSPSSTARCGLQLRSPRFCYRPSEPGSLCCIHRFRTYRFEGVSLKRLADATGLEKASLYYRYPGGKDAIAMAIARELMRWLQANVFDPLVGSGPHESACLLLRRDCGISMSGAQRPA